MNLRQFGFCLSLGTALAVGFATMSSAQAQGYYSRPSSSASLSVRNYGLPPSRLPQPVAPRGLAYPLAGLQLPPPSAYANNGTASQTPSLGPSANPLALPYAHQQYNRGWQAPPSGGNPQAADLSSAVKRIGDEALMNKDQLSSEGNRYINNTQSQAQIQANAYIDEGYRVANQMKNAYYYTSSKTRVPMYTTQDINATQQQYQDKANEILAAGQRRQQGIQQEYQKRQESLLESAQNLQTQLTEKPAGSDSVMLQPIGTNLYVRNYQSIGEMYDQQVPPVQPQNAVPMRGTYESGNRPATHVGPGYAGPYTDPAQAKPGHYMNPGGVGNGVRTVVSGRLVREPRK